MNSRANWENSATVGNCKANTPDLHVNVTEAQLGCKEICSRLLYLKYNFQYLFTPGLGVIDSQQHKMNMRNNVKPTSCKLRILPLTIQDRASSELNPLLKKGVIEKVQASGWVSPIVVVSNPAGSIRHLRGPYQAIVIYSFT